MEPEALALEKLKDLHDFLDKHAGTPEVKAAILEQASRKFYEDLKLPINKPTVKSLGVPHGRH